MFESNHEISSGYFLYDSGMTEVKKPVYFGFFKDNNCVVLFCANADGVCQIISDKHYDVLSEIFDLRYYTLHSNAVFYVTEILGVNILTISDIVEIYGGRFLIKIPISY